MISPAATRWKIRALLSAVGLQMGARVFAHLFLPIAFAIDGRRNDAEDRDGRLEPSVPLEF